LSAPCVCYRSPGQQNPCRSVGPDRLFWPCSILWFATPFWL